jgi:hypothetical protein
MSPESIDLTPAQAGEWLHKRLERATDALQAGDPSTALDGYVSAVGLALQLGPAPAQMALTATVEAAYTWAHLEDASALSALGPALVDLVTQVRDSDALSPTPVMEAWLAVTSELGALVGQVGLALSLPPAHRAGMLSSAHARAVLLDAATSNLFSLIHWIKDLLRATKSG